MLGHDPLSARPLSDAADAGAPPAPAFEQDSDLAPTLAPRRAARAVVAMATMAAIGACGLGANEDRVPFVAPSTMIDDAPWQNQVAPVPRSQRVRLPIDDRTDEWPVETTKWLAHSQAVKIFNSDGPTTLTTSAVDTSASGSSFVMGICGLDTDMVAAPTDSNGNAYTLIGSTQAYTDFTNYKSGVWWKNGGVGGAAHTFSKAVSNFEEMTSFALELTGVGRLQDFSFRQDANAGAPTTATSSTVTTTGPAVLVAFWWGAYPDPSIQISAIPGNGFVTIESFAGPNANGFIQGACAVKRTVTAGTYDVKWTGVPTQGAMLWLLAFEPPAIDEYFTPPRVAPVSASLRVLFPISDLDDAPPPLSAPVTLVDEDYAWPTRFVQATAPRVWQPPAASDDAVTPLAVLDEDFWATRPVIVQPWRPATAFYNDEYPPRITVDEDAWVPLVARRDARWTRLVNDDQSEVIAPIVVLDDSGVWSLGQRWSSVRQPSVQIETDELAICPPDETGWIPPLPRSAPAAPRLSSSDDDAVFPVYIIEDDYWSSGVAPTVAASRVQLPLGDNSDDPAGSLYPRLLPTGNEARRGDTTFRVGRRTKRHVPTIRIRNKRRD